MKDKKGQQAAVRGMLEQVQERLTESSEQHLAALSPVQRCWPGGWERQAEIQDKICYMHRFHEWSFKVQSCAVSRGF
jgi:hypothetical protein